MITSSECSEFIGKRVAVGVTDFIHGGTFYYYGSLIDVTDDYVKLKMSIGYKQVFLKEIIEIKLVMR